MKINGAAGRLVSASQAERCVSRSIFEPSFLSDLDVKFALNFRPQAIFLRDRGEAFVIVRLDERAEPDPRSTLRFCKGSCKT